MYLFSWRFDVMKNDFALGDAVLDMILKLTPRVKHVVSYVKDLLIVRYNMIAKSMYHFVQRIY